MGNTNNTSEIKNRRFINPDSPNTLSYSQQVELLSFNGFHFFSVYQYQDANNRWHYGEVWER